MKFADEKIYFKLVGFTYDEIKILKFPEKSSIEDYFFINFVDLVNCGV